MNLLYSNDTQGKYPESWYSATAEPLRPFQNLKGSKKYDICVVGACYTGLSSALHLSKLGYSVAVLDAHRVGFGAPAVMVANSAQVREYVKMNL